MEAATHNSNPEVLKILLENGADAAIQDKEGKKALDYANRNHELQGTEVYDPLRGKTLP